jgi:hypothetical protein
LGTTHGRALYANFEHMTDQSCTLAAVLKSNFHILITSNVIMVCESLNAWRVVYTEIHSAW